MRARYSEAHHTALENRSLLASRVVEERRGAARLLFCSAPVPDVVSFRGSFKTGPDFSTDDDLVQQLVVDLLDKGTRRRGRFEIATELEGRGAQLHLYADNLRVGFAGRTLAEDLDAVLALLFEQILEPALPAEEFDKERRQAIASIRRSMDSTAGQATGALTRRLYPRAHPNYVPEPEEELARLDRIALDDLAAYHGSHFGPAALTMVFSGDVDHAGTGAAVDAAISRWASAPRVARFDDTAVPLEPGRVDVQIADRPNLDVRMGHPLEMRRDSPDWLAAHAGAFALGGNFSSRLMQTVRDERGLTYGIGASLHNLSVEHDGHFFVHASLSAAQLGEGLAAIRGVIEDFVDGGITPAELARVQDTLAGQHVVAMATTSGLAARLLVNAERGFDIGYLDRFPEDVRALTVDDVNAAVSRHIRPADLHVAVAGSVPTGSP